MLTSQLSISKDGRTLKHDSYFTECSCIKSSEVLSDPGSGLANLVIYRDIGPPLAMASSTYHNAETIHRRLLARAKQSDPVRVSEHESPDSTEYFY